MDKFSRRAVDLALSFRHVMRMVRTRKMSVHNKMLRDSKHYAKLSADERRSYEATWLKTGLVIIQDGGLVAKLFHAMPP